MRIPLLLFALTALFFIYSCEKDGTEPPEGVGIFIKNNLDQKIDTLLFWVNTSTYSDSLLFRNIDGGNESEVQYLDELKYYFIEEEDIFIISKGFFKINEVRYDLSNCFCDPKLNEGMLPDGDYSINVLEIDALRGNVEYIIEKK